MLRFIMLAALVLHGIGHVLFLANVWGYWNTGAGQSSVLGGLLGAGSTAERVVGLLWLLPTAGFLAGVWALIGRQAVARPLVLGSAVLSAALIILWWGRLVPGSAVFALAVDLAAIAVLLWRPEFALRTEST